MVRLKHPMTLAWWTSTNVRAESMCVRQPHGAEATRRARRCANRSRQGRVPPRGLRVSPGMGGVSRGGVARTLVMPVKPRGADHSCRRRGGEGGGVTTGPGTPGHGPGSFPGATGRSVDHAERRHQDEDQPRSLQTSPRREA